MEENSFFQKALADFTHEAASGGAIRHLTDMGYTVKQIKETLDFPTSYERVQKAVWEHLIAEGVILLEEPGKARPAEKAVYVREYDKYGKASFRRVSAENKELTDNTVLTESTILTENSALTEKSLLAEHAMLTEPRKKIPGAGEEALSAFLNRAVKANGAEFSYMSCRFGLTAYRDPAQYREMLHVLESRQREYIDGLPWEKKKVYHRLDDRMREILMRLYRAGYYHGECYFLKTREKIDF